MDLLFLESFIYLVLDCVFVELELRTTVQFGLKSEIVAIELSLDSEERPDVAYSLNCHVVCMVEHLIAVFIGNVFEKMLVVVERWIRRYGYMASVGLNDDVHYALDVFWKQAEISKLVDPVSDFITNKRSQLG